jgi:hypothetical protein
MELVVVAPILTQIEAEILKGKLDSEGIEAFLGSSNLVQARASYSNRVDGIKVSVWEKDYEKAMAIIGETMPPQSDSVEAEPNLTAVTDEVNLKLENFLQSKENRIKVVLLVIAAAILLYAAFYLSGNI